MLMLLSELPLLWNFIRIMNSSSWWRNYISWFLNLYSESWPIPSHCFLTLPFCWLISTIFSVFPQHSHRYLHTYTTNVTKHSLFFPQFKMLYLGFHEVTICKSSWGKSSFMSYVCYLWQICKPLILMTSHK